jgi:hypothetical protein
MKETEQMRELVTTAKRLRAVRQASKHFLTLWALEHMNRRSRPVERMAADVAQSADQAIADPHNHDWSILYRGSVLDD